MLLIFFISNSKYAMHGNTIFRSEEVLVLERERNMFIQFILYGCLE
jgi:hypothetical protein